MARYRLPDFFGSAEVKILEHFGSDVDVELIDVAPGLRLRIDVDSVIKIPPPLPDEPPVGAVVLVAGEAAQRFEDNGMMANIAAHWAGAGRAQRWTWVQICDLALPGEPVLMAADPFAEPVALPWIHPFDDGKPVRVSRSSASNRAAYVEGWGHLTTDEARAMALALWRTTLADQVESGQR